MCQFTIENQGMQAFLVYQLKDEEEVDQACYKIIHDKQVPGLLPTFLSTKEEKQCLKFNISSRVSLKQYLKGSVQKKEFLLVLSSVIDTLRHCKEYLLDPNYTLLTSSYIYVNVETKETELLFCPIIKSDNKEDIQSRLKQLILQMNFASSENSLYASRITSYLERKSTFSFEDLEKLVEEIKAEKESDLGKLFQAGKIKMPAMNLTQAKQPEPAQENWVGPKDEDVNSTKLTAQKPELSNNNNTKEKLSIQVMKACLKRVKTNEQILIHKQVFKIGKEKNFVDYCIMDNPTISRSHANIVIENEEYYIMDMNSKNHTFVNKRMLRGTEKVKLIHGSRVQLSDEEFVFCLEL